MKTLYKTVPSGTLIFEDGVLGEVGLNLFSTPAAMRRQNPSLRYVDADSEPIAVESCSDAPDAAHRCFRSGFWLRSLPVQQEPASDVPDVPADLQEQSREWDRLGAYPTTAGTMGEPLRVDAAGNEITTAVSPDEALQQRQEPPAPRIEEINGCWYLDGCETVVEPTEENIRLSRDDDPATVIARMHGEQVLRDYYRRQREAEQG